MERIIEAQGGDPAVVEGTGRLPTAPVRREVHAARAGRIVEVRARPIGQAAVALGAGPRTLADRIHPGVGFQVFARPGAAVAEGDPLGVVHAVDEFDARAAAETLARAVRIGGDDAVETLPLISHRIDADGVSEVAAA